jgi:hypothetical protein
MLGISARQWHALRIGGQCVPVDSNEGAVMNATRLRTNQAAWQETPQPQILLGRFKVPVQGCLPSLDIQRDGCEEEDKLGGSKKLS